MSQNRVDDRSSQFAPSRIRFFRILQYSVLAVGLMAMIAITAAELHPTVRARLAICLWCCLGFFSVELVIKGWAKLKSKTVLSYLLSASGVIDLMTVLPIPLVLLIGVPTDIAWLLASLWLLKLAAFVPGLSLLGRVIALEARPLASVLVIFLTVLLFAGVALYILERVGQPERFGSLPLSLWWAVSTLTTTGYGNSVPQTFVGRMIAGLVMICGLGVFGLWTGILATGFAAEHRRRDFIQNWDLVTRVPFLRNLDPPAIIELTRMLRRLDLAERTVVVRRGRPGDCMYFIVSGEVEVKLDPRAIRLGGGSFFGEIALLGGSPRTATVVTTLPSTLLVLDVSNFRVFMAHHPDLAREVEMEAARRNTANEHVLLEE